MAALTYERNLLLVSEWAEKNRVLPPSVTAIPGPWDNSVTPYLVELMDCFSEGSPVQKIAIMKGSQIGFTTGLIENSLGYIIDHTPGPCMFVAGDKAMAEQSIELRIDKMLESSGLQDKIFSQTKKLNNRKTGDTKQKKEFPGGYLVAVGPNSPAKLRSLSIKYLFFDELDAYPISTGIEGDPVTLAEKRTDSFESIRKIAYISTPLIEGSSKIAECYHKGDQRKYYIPCVHCEEYQVLEWNNIKYDKDEEGNVVYDSVRYECPFCKKFFKNSDKVVFLERGEWRPTKEAKEFNYRSYHLNSLYSPIGMRSWESTVQDWNNIEGDVQKLQAFVNTVLGEPWIERGQAPNYEKVLARREKYTQGTINKNVLILTGGVDIQKDRIEVELTGWGKKKENWSIEYKIFESEFENVEHENPDLDDDNCWQKLDEFLTKKFITEDGRHLVISMCFIDSSYATSTVYQFCEKYNGGVYPIQGFSKLGPRKAKAIIQREVSGYELVRYDVMVDIFKDEIATALRKDAPIAGTKYPAGYCHFPGDYNESYFKQLTAEERFLKTDSKGNKFYVWENRKNRRNEAFDCRVYSLAALNLFYDLVSAEYEEEDMPWARFWGLLEETNSK